jgi:hypothetical protein
MESEYGWDFSPDNSEIIVTHYGTVVMRIGMCEVIDSIDPEFLMGHIYNHILPCTWEIGKWPEYFAKKILGRLEE